MRAVLRNLESWTPTTTTTKKKKTSAFYDSEPPYAARVIRNYCKIYTVLGVSRTSCAVTDLKDFLSGAGQFKECIAVRGEQQKTGGAVVLQVRYVSVQIAAVHRKQNMYIMLYTYIMYIM